MAFDHQDNKSPVFGPIFGNRYLNVLVLVIGTIAGGHMAFSGQNFRDRLAEISVPAHPLHYHRSESKRAQDYAVFQRLCAEALNTENDLRFFELEQRFDLDLQPAVEKEITKVIRLIDLWRDDEIINFRGWVDEKVRWSQPDMVVAFFARILVTHNHKAIRWAIEGVLKNGYVQTNMPAEYLQIVNSDFLNQTSRLAHKYHWADVLFGLGSLNGPQPKLDNRPVQFPPGGWRPWWSDKY
jgi:hypothetical protein